MPRVGGREEGPRGPAPDAPPRQPAWPSASWKEGGRLFGHRRSRSFSNFEVALDDDGDGGGAGGRKQQQPPRRRQPQQQQQQQREQRRSQDQHHLPRNQPRVVDVGCRGVGAGFGRRRSFSYHRLPEHQLRLTIVKLDRSSFDVHIIKSAIVLDLKLAVEEIFTRSPEGEAVILWSLVWTHFCLCYKDQKLTDDKASLRAFGIKDGDELHFVRHVSINYNPVKRRPRKHGNIYDGELTGLQVHQESEKDEIDSDDIKTTDEGSKYVDKHHDSDRYHDRPPSQFKAAHSSRGWLSYSGFWFSARAMLGTKRPSF